MIPLGRDEPRPKDSLGRHLFSVADDTFCYAWCLMS
jgi:hypothetical protein